MLYMAYSEQLPSSLRPGGASYFFGLWDENIPRLLWRGRWASHKMLVHYVQELTAATMLLKLLLFVALCAVVTAEDNPYSTGDGGPLACDNDIRIEHEVGRVASSQHRAQT